MQKPPPNYLSLSLLLIISLSPYQTDTKAPTLTIILEIDQFASHYLPHIQPYVTGGIKFLLEQGTRYTNAYWPHAKPSTSIGHVAINTGTFANYHGVVGNTWRDKDLNEIKFEDDTSEDAAVFSPEGFYSWGKSAHHIKVDGISDQLLLASTSNAPITVYAISYKAASSIGNAGKLGKALWFDTKAGVFTSSKAYFKELPHWIKQFNKKIPPYNLQDRKWKPFFNVNHPAYATADSTEVAPFQRALSVIGDKIYKMIRNDEDPYEAFARTPPANALLLDLAKTFISHHLKTNKKHRLVLWISLSPLDRLVHFFGPQSKEALDMIYHIDYQLKQFMNFVYRRFKEPDVLYVLTADHGVDPIPEYLYRKGIKSARRIYIPQLRKEIEKHIQKTHNISIKCAIETPQLYLDNTFNTLSRDKQDAIIKTIKEFLEQKEGIKKVWKYNEIVNECINETKIEYYYKNQQFPGRSGLLTFQVFPYVQVTKQPSGTSHATPYEWNTHVPLIFYQKGLFERKEINKRVWLLQVPNTLAQIHHVPKPSASTFNILPGLISEKLSDS